MNLLTGIVVVVDCLVGLLYFIAGVIDTFTNPGKGWLEIILGVWLILNAICLLYMAQHGGD